MENLKSIIDKLKNDGVDTITVVLDSTGSTGFDAIMDDCKMDIDYDMNNYPYIVWKDFVSNFFKMISQLVDNFNINIVTNKYGSNANYTSFNKIRSRIIDIPLVEFGMGRDYDFGKSIDMAYAQFEDTPLFFITDGYTVVEHELKSNIKDFIIITRIDVKLVSDSKPKVIKI